MRISDWSSDVCSSDLRPVAAHAVDRAVLRWCERLSKKSPAELGAASLGGGAHVREAHVDRRVGFGLRDFKQGFAGQFEHGQEMHKDDSSRVALMEALHEKLGENHESHITKAAQYLAHVIPHGATLAREGEGRIRAGTAHE